jgi:hypothetical protein
VRKRKWLAVVVSFFLFSDVVIPSVSSAINFPLTQIKVDPNTIDRSFKKIYDSVCFALSVYVRDVIGRSAKENLIRDFSDVALHPGIRFDLEKIDMIKKGWTRYYPFSIDGKEFIMRIFLTSERSYLPAAPILYEGSIATPAVTFQVLPSLNTILSDCKIKPHRAYSPTEVNRSS